MGAVLHTLNIRLFEDDLRYIVGHAKDKVIFLDASLADVMPRFEGVEHEVLMPDADGDARRRARLRAARRRRRRGLRVPRPRRAHAPPRSATRAARPGKPKGVLYSHRSTVLHSLGANQADALGLSEHDSVMPVVPMFHANAWGLPYARRPPARGSWCPARG